LYLPEQINRGKRVLLYHLKLPSRAGECVNTAMPFWLPEIFAKIPLPGPVGLLRASYLLQYRSNLPVAENFSRPAEA